MAFFNFRLFILQLILLTIYCVPPIRLKKFICAGIIADALYNSVIPVFVIVFIIREYAVIIPETGSLIITVLFFTLLLKGLRGILLHQLADRKNDGKAGVHTFALYHGALKTFNLTIRVILPLEMIFNVVLTSLLSKHLPGISWLFIIFFFYKALKLRFWNIRYLCRWEFKFYRFIFLQSMNDWYEEWLPLYTLIVLVVKDISFLFLLIPYILLFPAFFKKFLNEIPEAIVNFRNDLKNKFLKRC